MRVCANCRRNLRYEDPHGESSLYSPNQSFDLCDPCWLEEQAAIDLAGTNDIPERLDTYRQNVATARAVTR